MCVCGEVGLSWGKFRRLSSQNIRDRRGDDVSEVEVHDGLGERLAG